MAKQNSLLNLALEPGQKKKWNRVFLEGIEIQRVINWLKIQPSSYKSSQFFSVQRKGQCINLSLILVHCCEKTIYLGQILFWSDYILNMVTENNKIRVIQDESPTTRIFQATMYSCVQKTEQFLTSALQINCFQALLKRDMTQWLNYLGWLIIVLNI